MPQAAQEPFGIYPVGEIVENLCKIDDAAWARYAFLREPLNGKFNDPQRLELTRKALACGSEIAAGCVRQHGTSDPALLAQRLQLMVAYPATPQNLDRVLFAEYREPNLIRVYMDCLNRAEKLFCEPGVAAALGDGGQIKNLLIAHELYHHLEKQLEKEVWTRAYRVTLWKLGPIRNRSTVSALSEIAAMGFSKELTGVPYSPYVLDAFLVYGYSPQIASELYEEMMRFAKEPYES
uniref:Uncharacterized protein n=1 Tax=uncultured bacterium contig00074 TaxID=1181553 RepID=A0A806KKI0_9BACT|nr:hypothetical protein [uncultured bacterium contig00074]